MAAVVFPRRVASTATTITVSSATSQLSIEAGLTASNTFRAFTGNGLSTRAAHPTTGTLCDPTEDGQGASGNTAGGPGSPGNKTAIDWAGKGCYDSQGKKVMWAGTGAFGGVADTPINTMAVYDEVANAWTAIRGWTAGGETSTDKGAGHMYDGNCIDVTGRKFYKKKFGEKSAYVRDLTAGTWSKLTYTSGEPGGYAFDVGMDYVPSRGKLWIRGLRSGDNASSLFELDPASGTSTTLLSGGAIGADAYASVCSFNPRAFGGAGGCFVGGTNAYTVRSDGTGTPATVQSNATGKPSTSGVFVWYADAHLCRDPVGDGWIYASTDGFVYRLSSAGVWTQRAQLPQTLRDANTNWGIFNFVMVPIDAYGVIWFIANQGLGAERAWLYKP